MPLQSIHHKKCSRDSSIPAAGFQVMTPENPAPRSSASRAGPFCRLTSVAAGNGFVLRSRLMLFNVLLGGIPDHQLRHCPALARIFLQVLLDIRFQYSGAGCVDFGGVRHALPLKYNFCILALRVGKFISGSTHAKLDPLRCLLLQSASRQYRGVVGTFVRLREHITENRSYDREQQGFTPPEGRHFWLSVLVYFLIRQARTGPQSPRAPKGNMTLSNMAATRQRPCRTGAWSRNCFGAQLRVHPPRLQSASPLE